MNVFSKSAINYKSAIILFYPKDAIEVIKYCKKLKRKIYGIDAFDLSGKGIQPFMEHSIDYSSNLYDDTWTQAISHVEKLADKGLVFEIVYEKPQ